MIYFIRHRMTVFLLLSLFLLALVVARDVCPFIGSTWAAMPSLLQVAVYKFYLLFAAAHAGYWIDRVLFYYARPDHIGGQLTDCLTHETDEVVSEFIVTDSDVFNACMIRRTLIVAAAIIAVALGA